MKEKYRFLVDYFSEHNPNASSELEYHNAFELLVAGVLSAQCTDKRVNMVTKNLFKKYATPEQMADASVEEIYELITSVSYPNNKAMHLKGLAQKLVSDFQGQVPDNREGLESLPGVGRKTANVILSIIFQQPTMAVDTHVFRVAHRLGIVENANTPLAVEQQLTKNFPSEKISIAHHWLILHGRYVCTARSPHCDQCALPPICNFYKKNH